MQISEEENAARKVITSYGLEFATFPTPRSRHIMAIMPA
jgi:hypothetical protein